MSFAASQGNVEAKTGRTPDDLMAMARRKNLTEPKAIVEWLTTDYGLEPEDARAVARAILAGPGSDAAPGTGGPKVGGRRKAPES